MYQGEVDGSFGRKINGLVMKIFLGALLSTAGGKSASLKS